MEPNRTQRESRPTHRPFIVRTVLARFAESNAEGMLGLYASSKTVL